MSDSAVMPSWRVRPRERERGLPGTPKLWAMTGGAILAATLLGAGVWWWLGEGAGRGVPLVTAETTPFRVRPEDPGGLRVANQGSEVFNRSNTASAPPRPGESRLGAAPETPRPEAMRPEAPRPAPAPATPPVAPPVAAPAALLAAPAIAPPAAPGTGRAQVQLAATRSEETAQQEWRRLQARIPELQGRQPVITRLDRGEGQPPLFRIRTGGFADQAAARAFCEQLRARDHGCLVVGG